MNHVLLTGATGFVGQRLQNACRDSSIPLKCAVRSLTGESESGVFSVGSIDGSTNWNSVLLGVDVVIHLAARAHIMKDSASDPLIEYRKVNCEGTLNLAWQAASAGVKRFIFISTIKVNGELTAGRNPFTENVTEPPDDYYGLSKYEAEIGLREVSVKTGMEVVIIRPPLVYGPSVKANFRNLIKLADSAIPLPFGWIHNKRSMVYVENLVDFIIQCIGHPAAANQTFLVSDGEDISLSGLISMMRKFLGRPVRILPVPLILFRIAGRLTGKKAVVDRLIGDLRLDSSKGRELLHWRPPFSVEQGINATITAYLEGMKSEDKKSVGW